MATGISSSTQRSPRDALGTKSSQEFLTWRRPARYRLLYRGEPALRPYYGERRNNRAWQPFSILFCLDAPLFRCGAALTGLISANALKHNGQPWRSWPEPKTSSCASCREVFGAVSYREFARYIKSPSGPVTLHRKPAPWRGGRVVMQRTANPGICGFDSHLPPTSRISLSYRMQAERNNTQLNQ